MPVLYNKTTVNPCVNYIIAVVVLCYVTGLGYAELAKYPFLADAGRYLREYGFTLAQLADDPDMAPVRELAFRRVTAAAGEGQVYRPSIQRGSQLPLEVFSFLLAVVLIKMAGGQSLAKKFAMQEARGAETLLERDLGRAYTDSQIILTTNIIRDLSGITVKKQQEDFVVPVTDYLRRAVTFHAREWELINRRVESGMVYLSPHETVRLIRQELVNYIISRIEKVAAPPNVPGLQEFVIQLSAIESRLQPKKVARSGKFAPCIKHAVKTLANGDNLSHAGRFLLATYLLARGYAIDDVVPYFEKAPDYKKSVTLYQIRHLAGKHGRGASYRCQSCEKLMSLGLCHRTPQCAGIINPLQFDSR